MSTQLFPHLGLLDLQMAQAKCLFRRATLLYFPSWALETKSQKSGSFEVTALTLSWTQPFFVIGCVTWCAIGGTKWIKRHFRSIPWAPHPIQSLPEDQIARLEDVTRDHEDSQRKYTVKKCYIKNISKQGRS